MACNESIQVWRDSGRSRAGRGAFVSRAISLQHLVVDERATRTSNGIDSLEHVRIGVRRVDTAFRPSPVGPWRALVISRQCAEAPCSEPGVQCTICCGRLGKQAVPQLRSPPKSGNARREIPTLLHC